MQFRNVVFRSSIGIILFSILSQAAVPPPIPSHVCKRITAKDSVKIDGILNEGFWSKTDSLEFRINMYSITAKPKSLTKVRVVWDSTALYVAFSASDDSLKGTYLNRDDYLWREEPVELFLDADGDGNNIYEFEWNCRNALVDLFYPAYTMAADSNIMKYNALGIQSAVKLRGTVNNASDRDTGMTIEIAIPWTDLDSNQAVSLPPKNGDVLRANFCRYNRDASVLISQEAGAELSAWSPTDEGFKVPGRMGYLYISDSLVNPAGIKGWNPRNTSPGSPMELRINRVSPNTINLGYFIPENGHVQLDIYRIFGELVYNLISRDLPAGQYEADWNYEGLIDSGPSGVYFTRLSVNNYSVGKRFFVVR